MGQGFFILLQLFCILSFVLFRRKLAKRDFALPSPLSLHPSARDHPFTSNFFITLSEFLLFCQKKTRNREDDFRCVRNSAINFAYTFKCCGCRPRLVTKVFLPPFFEYLDDSTYILLFKIL